MPASQANITASTPMGANVAAGGVTFRIWAPRARAVYVRHENNWNQDDASLLVRDSNGYWAGFIPGLRDGSQYKFFVVGPTGGLSTWKRDPYARELTTDEPFPQVNCIVRDPRLYLWHDHAFRPPRFNDLIVYELHIGTFYLPRGLTPGGQFLDVLHRLEYLVDLGVNAIELMPVVEFQTEFSLGYNGTDYF